MPEAIITSKERKRAAGKLAREEGHNYEDRFIFTYGGIKPEGKVASIHGKKTTPKVDVILDFEKFSLKNSTGSTQIQICSFENFNTLFNVPGDVEIGLRKFLGAFKELYSKTNYKNNPEFFEEFCRERFSTGGLCPKDELRRSRLKTDNIKEIDKVIEWIDENKQEIIKFIFSTGFASEEKYHSNKLVYVRVKNCLDQIDIIDISKIIEKSADWPISIANKKTVIKIGPITLQMKGSGTGSAYHSLQFNAKRTDLLKYLD
jgi:hypothetical protein